MALVVTGLLNKQVGFELGISEITVKAHRGKVMRKMKADSLAGTESLHLSIGHRPYRPTQTAGKSLQRAGAPLLDTLRGEPMPLTTTADLGHHNKKREDSRDQARWVSAHGPARPRRHSADHPQGQRLDDPLPAQRD